MNTAAPKGERTPAKKSPMTDHPAAGPGAQSAELRPCTCADPENCTIPVPGYYCRRGWFAPVGPGLPELLAYLKVATVKDALTSINGLRERVKFTEDYESLRLLAALREPPPQEGRQDEEVVVAQLAACEAAISHLWDVAGFFDIDQCNRVRDVIHRLNKLTLPAIRDLKAASPISALREPPEAQDGWQPITDDQKDGNRILVMVPGMDGPYDVVVVCWDRDPEDEAGQCWRTDDHERIEFEALLWWPLPKAGRSSLPEGQP